MLRTTLSCSLVIAAACTGCADAPVEKPTPIPAPSGYHVSSGFLRDPQGRALLLRGMNLGGQKVAPYLDFETLPDYQRVRDAWGMNVVRFIMPWAAVEPKEGVYDDAYLDEIAKRMDWARKAGIYVVLDMHQDVYGEGFASGGGDGAPLWSCDAASYKSFVPNPTKWFLNNLSPEVTGCWDHFWKTDSLRAHYVEAWRRVAKRLSGYDDVVLGFDPMNEPYWGSSSLFSFEADLLQPLYDDVVAAVRGERPAWIAFLEPGSNRNVGIATSLVPFSYPDVVYSPHSYDRDAESGLGFDAAHRAAVIQNAADLAGEAKMLGAGLWVGEYGGMSDSPGITDYMDAEYAAFAAVAAGTTYWSYSKGGSYSVLDENGVEKKTLLAALVRPWPERVAGAPVSYGFDASTGTFTLTYQPDPAIGAPTVIRVPERAYPNGYKVECGGCTTERAPGELRVVKPQAGASVTVTLHP
jgi:endoglycosylceramidase